MSNIINNFFVITTIHERRRKEIEESQTRSHYIHEDMFVSESEIRRRVAYNKERQRKEEWERQRKLHFKQEYDTWWNALTWKQKVKYFFLGHTNISNFNMHIYDERED